MYIKNKYNIKDLYIYKINFTVNYTVKKIESIFSYELYFENSKYSLFDKIKQ